MRGRVAGCAAVLLMLLTGCGEGGSEAEAKPTRTPKPTAAPGVDGDADPGTVFTAAELTAALLPAKAVGPKAKALNATSGVDGRLYGGGDWGACAPGKKASTELFEMRGTTAGHMISPFPGANADDEDPVLSQTLVSMPDARAERHVELRRQLHKACPSVTVDTDAAPVVEHHAVEDLPDIGDEAILESKRYEGGDDYDAATRYYKAEVRVGGVLVLVDAGPHKDLTISSAAKAAARVRTELYKAS
ncbi:hypothetical protein ACGFSB_29930 [Streptomyces sp. NPDC048441]|uniref:hypothetical protein n=1 Tax=Streptomyces sp. NPDC048441 TaxID=3365552 RepID=UPI0037238165